MFCECINAAQTMAAYEIVERSAELRQFPGLIIVS